ncbi:MAG: cytochrome P450 [Emcibacter sp.]|nr:cytochrome P450 [Emcibacter sp.]
MKFSENRAQQIVDSFDFKNLPADFYTNPFPYYHALREIEPVKKMPDGSILLSRYNDIEFVYKNPKIFSSDKRKEFKPKYGDTLLYEHHTTSLVFNDPPLHTRVKRLISGALTPRAIAAMEPSLILLVEELLDKMAQKETCDLISDYASAIPVEVIGNLLDVPHEDREPLRDWSLNILGALEPYISQDVMDKGNRSVHEFILYLEGLIEDRRRNPGNPDGDVLTRLIQGEADGEKLTPKELLHNCIFLLNAGHETTTNLIGNGLVTLLEHPEQKQRLIDNPDLIKTAVDEFLRFESPNQLGNRITTEAIDIGGVHIPAQTPITLCMAAGNRDPEKFDNPDHMDISRTPNRHLAFAGGIHQCSGLALAKLEGKIAVSHLLNRYPNYSIAGDTVRGGRIRFRGYLSVPCKLK